MGFANVQEVFKPTDTGLSNVVEAPEDMVGWLQHHPYLQTDKPEPITVGGVKGEQFDVVLGDLREGYSGVCGSDCVGDRHREVGRLVEAPRPYSPECVEGGFCEVRMQDAA